MINLDPLHDAFFATDVEEEGDIIQMSIHSFNIDSPWPRRMYDAGDRGPYISDYTWKSLRKVLQSIDDIKEGRREEIKRRGKRALDFSKEGAFGKGEDSSAPKRPRPEGAKEPSTRINPNQGGVGVAAPPAEVAQDVGGAAAPSPADPNDGVPEAQDIEDELGVVLSLTE
uniref:Uncharacterized protein n=1 Tax=Chenopodium quinoa TaxID=63459 RepID=A0A803MV09_CHEQI